MGGSPADLAAVGAASGDVAVDGGAGDVGAEVADGVARGIEAGDVAGGLQVDLDAAANQDRFVLLELDHVLAQVDALIVHGFKQAGVAFLDQAPLHVGEVFFGDAGAVHVDGVAGLVLVTEDAVPYVGGDVTEFLGGLGDEGAAGLAVDVAQHADPGGLAAAGKVLGAGVGVGHLDVDRGGWCCRWSG